MATLGTIIRLMEKVVPMLGVGTEAGKDVLKALSSLSKHLPPGAVSPGVEQSQLQSMLMKMRQQTPQIAAMRAGNAAPPTGGTPAPASAAA